MIELNIPGRGVIKLEHLVCDVNGTLAVDGRPIEGVAKALRAMRSLLEVHLLTADTHANQNALESQLGLQASRITPGNEADQKGEYVLRLGAQRVVAIGQGANDAQMLKEAAIGICLLSPEGLAVETFLAADVLVSDFHAALELLDKPLRLVATLRK